MAKKNKGNNKGSYSNQNRQSYVTGANPDNCTAQQSDATNKKGQMTQTNPTNKNKSTGMQG